MTAHSANLLNQFDRFAKSYRELHNSNIALSGESSEYFAAYKANVIAAVLAGRAYCKILDYGCGIGLVGAQLKRNLPLSRIDGFDVSVDSLYQVDPALRKQGVFTNKTAELGSDYDVVVLANVLHHVEPKDRQQTVSKVSRLLASDGKLMVFEHNPANPLTRRAVAQCPFDKNVQLLWPGESTAYISGSGLHTVSLEYIVFFPRFLRWLRPVEPALGWFPAGAQYVVTGSRR